jgi:AcrR family transcriptional regulator
MRGICKQAGTGPNMIHHYFDNMQGLYDAIVGQFSADMFDASLRIIATEPKSHNEMVIKLELFMGEILEGLITQRFLFSILQHEKQGVQHFQNYRIGFGDYLVKCQQAGFLRSSLNTIMVPGFLLDRLGNQIRHASFLEEGVAENIITNTDYRSSWLTDNTSILLFGLTEDNPH